MNATEIVLSALLGNKGERKLLVRGWLLLSPTFLPYLTEDGLKEREKLLRALADANTKSPHNKGERAA